jgi:hypothetical protein
MKSLLNEIEIMGIVHLDSKSERVSVSISKGVHGMSPLHVNVQFVGKMFVASSGMQRFSVELRAYESEQEMLNDRDMIFNTDAIVLNECGLRILSKHCVYDRLNNHLGLGLLERIIDLQSKRVTKLTERKDVAEGDDLYVRTSIASDISREVDLLEKGYNIYGGTIDVRRGDCMMCEKPDKMLVQLVCSHGYCVDCISEHICNISTVSSSKCPLCMTNFQHTR